MDTYEKKYKDALERARNLHKDAIDMDENIRAKQCEIIFPELKESEDERMRNVAINACKYMVDNFENSTKQYEEAIAWLEKQGKQILANSCKTCKDEPFDYENANIQQKDFAPRVEPKFKVGDCVIDKQDIVHQIANVIENVTNHTYGYDIVGGGYFNDNTEGVRLWTIKDAKDGDMLAAYECLILFKKLDGLNIKCYCTYHYMGFNPSFYIDTLQNKDAFQPATKEQRDTLIKAIADAGYEWNAEKKELKKISQRMVSAEAKEAMYDKPAWSVEDEKEYKYVLKFVDNTLNNCGNKKDYERCKRCYDWLRTLKQRIERR